MKYEILVGKYGGKRPLKRPRHGCEDIKMDLKKTQWHGMGWLHLAHGRDKWWAIVNTVMNLWVP
jgi:hypothetical protein